MYSFSCSVRATFPRHCLHLTSRTTGCETETRPTHRREWTNLTLHVNMVIQRPLPKLSHLTAHHRLVVGFGARKAFLLSFPILEVRRGYRIPHMVLAFKRLIVVSIVFAKCPVHIFDRLRTSCCSDVPPTSAQFISASISLDMTSMMPCASSSAAPLKRKTSPFTAWAVIQEGQASLEHVAC